MQGEKKSNSSRKVTRLYYKWNLQSTRKSITSADLKTQLETILTTLDRIQSDDPLKWHKDLSSTERVALNLLGIQFVCLQVETRLKPSQLDQQSSIDTEKLDLNLEPTTVARQRILGDRSRHFEELKKKKTSSEDTEINDPIGFSSSEVVDSVPLTYKPYPSEYLLKSKLRKLKELSVSEISGILCDRYKFKATQETTAKAFNVSASTVSRLSTRFKESGWTWEHIENLTGAELLSIAVSNRKLPPNFSKPDFNQVHSRYNGGETLTQIWTEYRERCADAGLKAYSYPQFCELYSQEFGRVLKSNVHLP
jgi:hypothetical protein